MEASANSTTAADLSFLNLDEICPAWKKTPPAPTLDSIRCRLYYRENHKAVCKRKLLRAVERRGQCINPSSLEKHNITPLELVTAWLTFKTNNPDVPQTTKFKNMQKLVSSLM